MSEEHRRNTDDIVLRLEGKIDKIYDILVGNGTVSNPGLLTRIDRLEQLEQSRTTHRGILYTAMTGLIVERIWHWFSGR